MKQTIEIIVTPQGQLQIDAMGFKGPDCALATRYLEEALGQVASCKKKPEFYQTARKSSHQRVGK